MKLDILSALNAERAARRAAIVVTDVRSGLQRLVKAADIAKDALRPVLAEHLRTGKSGMEETAEGRVFLTVYVPAPQLVITGAVHISQALAPIAQLVGYDVTIVDPRTAFASIERFPDVKVDRRMAGPGAAAARHRPLHRLRRAHPRSEDRRSGADARARARLLLYRRARIEEDACPPPRTAQAARASTDADISPASTRRSGSISARCRRPRSRSRSSRRSPSGCARKSTQPDRAPVRAAS